MQQNIKCNNWSVRKFRDGDKLGIYELDKKIFPWFNVSETECEWINWWNWQFKDNPSGNAIIWIAESKGKIIGHYAIIPMKFKYNNNITTFAQSVSTMTDPDFRHQGIFETLAKEVFKDALDKGIHIIYGFPNRYSRPGFIKKLNWFDISSLQINFKPINYKIFLSLKINNNILLLLSSILVSFIDKVFYRETNNILAENVNIVPISFFDSRIDELLNKCCTGNQIMVAKDKDYLNWRYIFIPNAKYSVYIAEKYDSILGYIVIRCSYISKGIKRGVIYDIMAESSNVAGALILTAMKHFKEDKVDIIYHMITENNVMLQKAFGNSGFLNIPFIKERRLCAYTMLDYDIALLKDSHNWSIQLGDSDTV